MNKALNHIYKHPVYKAGLTVLAIVFLISLRYLLRDNLGNANELDVLPIARQAADPTWIPGDWYLNQPSGYRLLFNFILALWRRIGAFWQLRSSGGFFVMDWWRSD